MFLLSGNCAIVSFAVALWVGVACMLDEARGSQAQACLVLDGHSDYVIVTADDAIEAEMTAAQELRDHLRLISSAELPIIPESAYTGGAMVAVGFNAALPPALQAHQYGSPAPQELIIDIADDVLLLAGGRPRGALYAVYEFLEQLGVRWLTPHFTHIPTLSRVELPQQAYRYDPPVLSRRLCVGNSGDAYWHARNRLTSITVWGAIGEQFGGAPAGVVAEGPDMHTWVRLIPASVLKAHPEWMALVDGKREIPVTATWGLCLSNADVRRYLIKGTMEYARANPHVKSIWLGQNDGSQPCMCPDCQAFYDAHGGAPSSLIVQTINELSDAMAEEMPDRMVKTLAYSWGVAPPTNIKARDNVVLMFCGMNGWSEMEQWRQIAKHLDVYHYGEFQDYWSPRPDLYAKPQELQKLYHYGANHLYSSISRPNDSPCESVFLRGWVYAQVMWRPEANVADLIDEFVTCYHGEAAEAVRQAIAWRHQEAFDEEGELRSFHDSPMVASCVNPERVRQINVLLKQTHERLEDETIKKRLRFAWLPYLWADFWLGYDDTRRFDAEDETWCIPIDDAEVRRDYGLLAQQIMCEWGVTSLMENKKFNPEDLGISKMGERWPARLLCDGDVQAVVVPGVGGEIFDFKHAALGFSPLKPYWRGLAHRYPLFSGTQDDVNGRQITEYRLVAGEGNGVSMRTAQQGVAVQKHVGMNDGALNINLTAQGQGGVDLQLTTSVMFDLHEALGLHSTVHLEQTQGEWVSRVMGSETDFWFTHGRFSLDGGTGRVVIQCEDSERGLLLSINPEEIASLEYWHDTLTHGFPIEQCTMFRLFLKSPTKQPTGTDDTLTLGYSMQILPDVSQVLDEGSLVAGNTPAACGR